MAGTTLTQSTDTQAGARKHQATDNSRYIVAPGLQVQCKTAENKSHQGTVSLSWWVAATGSASLGVSLAGVLLRSPANHKHWISRFLIWRVFMQPTRSVPAHAPFFHAG